MLATGNADGRGIVAKVGDFGLSLKMDNMETHVSQMYQGTMSHMAPGRWQCGQLRCVVHFQAGPFRIVMCFCQARSIVNHAPLSPSAEIMLDGRVSKAADVYAFGITLWEVSNG